MSTTLQVLPPETALPYAATSGPQPAAAKSPWGWPNRILLNVDGSLEGDGAIAAALAFAHAGTASVEVVVTHAPRIPLPRSPNRSGSVQCEPCDRPEVARALRAARDRLRHVAPAREDRAGWNIRVEVGDPGA